MKYSRFLDKMKIRGGEPLTGLNVYAKMSEIHEIGGDQRILVECGPGKDIQISLNVLQDLEIEV